MKNINSIYNQIHEQLDRIFELCKKSLPNKFTFYFLGLDDEFDFDYFKVYQFETNMIYKKVQFLHELFTAKNEQGEYILKEGDLPNPKIKELEDKVKKIDKREVTLLAAGRISELPQSLRELFKQNCFAETQEEIDNLKLITW